MPHTHCCALAHPSLQGPEGWHPAPPALKEAAKQCAELASAAGVSLPRLAVKAAVEQAGSGVAVHLMGELCPYQARFVCHTNPIVWAVIILPL